MATVKSDLIEGSYAKRDKLGVVEAVRMCSIEGVTGSADAIIRNAIYDGALPAMESGYPNDSSGCILRYATGRGFAGDKLMVSLEYKRPALPTIGGGYALDQWQFLSDDTTTTTVQASKLPDSSEPFSAGFNDAAGIAIPPKTMSLAVRRIVRVIELQGVFSIRNHPRYVAVRNLANCVNAETFTGLQPGYWLCEGASQRRDSMGATLFVCHARFVTLMNEDWSQWAFVTDPFGQFVQPSFVNVGGPYQYGIRPSVEDRRIDGLLRIGIYQSANFTSAVGIVA